MIDPTPHDVYLDADVVVAGMFPGTTHSAASARFCRRLSDQSSRVYFSQILRLEIAQTVRKLATKPDRLPPDVRHDYQLDRWGQDFLVRQRWMTAGLAQFDAFLAQFAEVFEIPFRLRIWESSVGIMALEHLRSQDAVHLATARTIRVGHFATCDDDFRHVRDPRIWIIRDDHP